ncbi:Cuticle-degrading protease [Paramyrothecium foliicola]|nr:Cuticle-degrading protease [Paramyrothecium foliicola]
MRPSVLLALLPLVAAAPAVQERAPLIVPRQSEPIVGKFIVKLKPSVLFDLWNAINTCILPIAATADAIFAELGAFAVSLAQWQIDDLRLNPFVEYIEQEATFTIFANVVQNNAPLGLARLSNTNRGSYTYTYDDSAGAGACVYVLDTGVDTTHPEFEGRATFLRNYSNNSTNTGDPQGHGTHVAGIVAAKTYGVAKKARVFGVTVMNAGGDATTSALLSGMDFAVTDSRSRSGCSKGFIVNMSIGGPLSQAVNDAAANIVNNGLFFAAAAGNGDASGKPIDISNVSPASAELACTVGATDSQDRVASYSNNGGLLDLYAPGSSIPSLAPGNRIAYLSGVGGARAFKKTEATSSSIEVLPLLESAYTTWEWFADTYRLFISSKHDVGFLCNGAVVSDLSDISSSSGDVEITIDGHAAREIPGPVGQPFVGNLLQVYPNHLGNHQRLFDQDGHIYKTTIVGHTTYLTNDPEIAAIVFTESELFSKKLVEDHPPFCAKTPEAGLFLGDTDSLTWRVAHKFIPPASGPKAVRHCIPTMQKTIEKAFSVFNALDQLKEAWNVYPYMLKLGSQAVVHLTLDYAIRAVDKEGEKLPEANFVWPIVTVTTTLAGFTTTSALLSWAIYILVTCPVVQDRLIQELIDNDFSDEMEIIQEFTNKLTYLDRFTKELQRTNNPSLPPARTAKVDLILLGGFKLQKGSVVILSLPHIHNNASIWNNPASFDPDRWDTEEVKNRHRAAYLPFKAGPRICISFYFALQEFKVFLPKLVHRYKFWKDDDEKVEYKPLNQFVRPTNLYTDRITQGKMTEGKVVLFDLPSKDQDCACWSLNPWKTRLALNYKGIDYDTKWLEYPDVEPTLKSVGLPPGESKDTPWTIPAIRFPDGTYSMDSKLIIKELEQRYQVPQYPSLHLEDPATERAYTLVGNAMGKLKGNLLPQVPKVVLSDVSAEYFNRTRKSWFNMSLEELREKNGGEQAWVTSKEDFGRIAKFLKENSGPFVLGDKVSYADFILVSFLHFVKRMEGDEDFKRLNEWPEIIALYKACEPWLQKDK